MEEQASFETRAVLAPRRARRTRVALLVPVVALVAVAWAGLSGARKDQATAALAGPTTGTAQSRSAEASPSAAPAVLPSPRPSQVVGLPVVQLDDVLSRRLGRGDVVAVAGWYVATAVTDCPLVAFIRRDGSLPEVRRDVDDFKFCDRAGVLYASRPEPVDGRSRMAGLPAVVVTLVTGIIAPPGLVTVGRDATEVVLIGRFIESGDGCRAPATCSRELIVDHVAWTGEA